MTPQEGKPVELDDATKNEARERGEAALREFLADARVQAALDSATEAPPTETLAALGVPYQIGTGRLPPVTPEALACLAVIRSPILSDAAAVSEMDVYRALYLACKGAPALTPLMGVEQRREALTDVLAAAERIPALVEVYARLRLELEGVWSEFDTAAVKHAAQFGVVAPAEIYRVLLLALRDAQAGLAQIPPDAEFDGVKKKAAVSTASGSLGCKRSRRLSSACRTLLEWCGRRWSRSD